MSQPANPFRYFNSSSEVIRLVVMLYIRFRCRCAMLRTCCLSAVSIYAMRRCGSGGTVLVQFSLRKFGSSGCRGYLSTVLDDFSRYIIAWKLCANMRAENVTDNINPQTRPALR